MSAVNLENVSDEDLVAELERRNTLISSVWSIEDFRTLIEEDSDCADLSEEQIEEAAKMALDACSGYCSLKDALSERGNSYTSDRWSDTKEGILAKIKESAPTPS